MTKGAFRVMDSDFHTIEPLDLWDRHLDERYRGSAPSFERLPGGGDLQRMIRVGDLQIGELALKPGPVNGHHVHDSDVEPFWAAVEDLGVAVGFHPTGVSSLRDNVVRHLLGHPAHEVIAPSIHNPLEHMLTFASLTAGGVLERHP